jgi:ubiquitin-like 1-activating enzyme E1 B
MTDHNDDTFSPNSILDGLRATVGDALVEKIVASRLLVVGAGGIGCELLKNLALTGFTKVTVIDLDTIDVSNLNRQLLFRSQHVGQPKCVVACSVATQLAQSPKETSPSSSSASPEVEYVAMHGNVCDNSQFHVEFVKQFALILNALDNVVARRRVNRLALAAGVPLIEAGTTGYLGQVTTIHKASETACYECQTQETGKVYPICTIRSTPSAPVHCIVWAKELYKLLFGDSVQESMLYEDVHSSKTDDDTAVNGDGDADTHNGVAGDEQGQGEPSTYMESVLEFRELLEQQRQDGSAKVSMDSVQLVAVPLVRNLYVLEIQKQLDMDRYKTAQKVPAVLEEAVVTTTMVAPTTKATYRPTDVWSSPECVAEFIQCCHDALSDPAALLPAFDKDDVLAMRFVTAASNLRATIFGIEPAQSYYTAKGIAGNIIPAIATTNAIVAGLQILQCFAVLQAQLTASGAGVELTSLRDHCHYVNCLRNSTRNGLFLTAATLEPPNPKCFVCAKAIVPLSLNVNKWTLQDFIAKICKGDLGFENPSIAMDTGGFIWEEGDDADSEEFAANLPKLLPDLPCGGIHNGTVISIEDFSQDLEVQIAITHVDIWDREKDEDVPDDHKFVVGGTKPKPIAHGSGGDGKPSATTTVAAENGPDDEEIEVIADPTGAKVENGETEDSNKRLSDVTDEARPSKRAKSIPSGGDVIEIED